MKLALALAMLLGAQPAAAQIAAKKSLTLAGARRVYRVRLNVPGVRPASTTRTARVER